MKLPMKKLAFLTNIPAPYRVDFFNFLSGLRGLDVSAYFMRETEGDRDWLVDYRDFNFKYYVSNEFYFFFRRKIHFHFNPILLLMLLMKVWRKEITHLIVGGAWNAPTVMILAILIRLKLVHCKVLFWGEINSSSSFLSQGLISKFVSWARVWVINSFRDGVFLPGDVAKSTSEKWGLRSKVYCFPNYVSSEVFQPLSGKRFKSSGSLQILIVARIDESTKGLINFFTRVDAARLENIDVLIIGDGPDRSSLSKLILARGFNRVKLLGAMTRLSVMQHLATADFFLLPSLSDKNPLSAIEAALCGLPVIISNRCGNWPELVREPEWHGFVFDPYCDIQINNAIDWALNISESQYAKICHDVRSNAVSNFSNKSKYIDLFDQI